MNSHIAHARFQHLDWYLLALAFCLGAAGFLWRGHGDVTRAGLKAEKTFTFVPHDRTNLECRSQSPSLADCKSTVLDRRIVPAVTVNRELLLVKGVLASPAFSVKSERFKLTCRVVFREAIAAAEVRFLKRKRFERIQGETWLVEVEDCIVPAE